MRTTREARRKDVRVKWLNGLIWSSLTIVNPQSEDSWARIESMMPPPIEPNKRPSFRVSNKKGLETYKTAISAYKSLWYASENPPQDINQFIPSD
jgi:hypothetical protein